MASAMFYAVGYVRVSTDEQTATPDEQRKAIVELCRRYNWHLLSIYDDIGVSGSTDPYQRPGFRRAIEELKRVGGGMLVVWSIDRISRQSIYDQVSLIAELAKQGVFVFSVAEESAFLQLYGGINPYSMEQAGVLLEMRAVIARFERIMIKLRTRLAMQNPEVRRRQLQGMVRAGYTVVELLPEDVKKQILELRRQGYSIRKIAEKLGLSYRAVYKVVKQAGEPGPSEQTCPRCFTRMILKREIPPRLYCPNCGYEKYLVPTLQVPLNNSHEKK